MKIVVLSDSHIPVNIDNIPQEIYKEIKKCDLIVHAGDIVESFVLDELGKFAEVKAVQGNMDSADLKARLPKKDNFKVFDKNIGIIHSDNPEKDIVKVSKKSFKEKMDLVIFGHTHVVFNKIIDGTLYFNPGTVGDNVVAPYRSFGVITIEKNKDIKAEIIKL